MSKYSAQDIDVLQGLEGIRQKPTMYMGDRGEYMAFNCLKELVDNVYDEVAAGRNSTCEVVIDTDISTYIVADQGEADDDGHGNHSCQQAVFDGGGAALFADECLQFRQ